MKIFLKSLLLTALLLGPVMGQELFTEVEASLVPNGPLYTFRVLGDKDKSSFSAYGILIISPNGDEQMLDEFDSLLPEGSEADAFIVEDVNFDGYADLRIMKYMPGGANVNYYYWLYDPMTAAFQSAPNFEVLISPQVDPANKEVLSRQRVSANEYLTEYYKTDGSVPILVRKEERVYNPDGSGTLKLTKVNADGSLEVLESRPLAPGE